MAATGTAILEAQQHVLTCMCSALTQTAIDIEGQPGCPCRSGMVPGAQPLICCPDNCGSSDQEGGQLTVHIGRSYRSSNFPLQDQGDLSCKTAPKVLVVEFVVTLVRCVPVPTQQGNLPTMEQQSSAAEVAAIDWMTMETAASCCVPYRAGNRKATRIAVLDHAPTGPTGPNGPGGEKANCAGSILRLAYDLGAVCCPAPES
jgi:hypothetical protein